MIVATGTIIQSVNFNKKNIVTLISLTQRQKTNTKPQIRIKNL